MQTNKVKGTTRAKREIYAGGETKGERERERRTSSSGIVLFPKNFQDEQDPDDPPQHRAFALPGQVKPVSFLRVCTMFPGANSISALSPPLSSARSVTRCAPNPDVLLLWEHARRNRERISEFLTGASIPRRTLKSQIHIHTHTRTPTRAD